MKQQPVDRFKRVKELKKTENIEPQRKMSWGERFEFIDAPEDKMGYFRENGIFQNHRNWTGEQDVICLACRKEFKIKDYRLVRERFDTDSVYITCKHCSGTLINFKEVTDEKFTSKKKVDGRTLRAQKLREEKAQTKLREEKEIKLIVRRRR